MDSLILAGVVRILDRALTGRSLLAWDRLSDGEYLLRFATAAGDNLRISLRLPQPALHRLPHRDTPRAIPPDPFSGIAERELAGATLTGIFLRGGDRVVQMDWRGAGGQQRHLVAELLGKSANLLLLDAQGNILAFAREMASAFRAPEVGKPYQAPLPRPGLEGASLDPDRLDTMLERFAGATPTLPTVVGFLKALSPCLAVDFPHREGAVHDPVGELKRILTAASQEQLEPVLYTSEPLETLRLRPDAGSDPPLLSPLPLARPAAAVQTRFRDCEEAVLVASRLMEARLRVTELRERLSGALHREEARLRKLASKLEKEREESTRAEIHQRYGDLILACPGAKVVEGVIVVPDLYDPDAGEARIPADPGLSARENAEKHYARARKLRRGADKIRERMQGVEASLASIDRWRQRLDKTEDSEGLQILETELIRGRVLRPPPRQGSARGREAASADDSGIRKYRTEDGYVILVGKTSRDNDRLTFQIASPHDFWFHAADRSGAHVVVRNPTRLKELPMRVALSAARLAAHFSRAKGKGKVEVHYTLRKHVRKGKGFAPGLVTIRNHRTLEVAPGIPAGNSEGESEFEG